MLRLRVSISGGPAASGPPSYRLDSHPHTVLASAPGTVELAGDLQQGCANANVQLSFEVSEPQECFPGLPGNFGGGRHRGERLARRQTPDARVGGSAQLKTPAIAASAPSYHIGLLARCLQIWSSSSMQVSLSLQPPSPSSPDQRPTFCLAVLPPAPEASPAITRTLLFLLDCSASMAGAALDAAGQALLAALEQLSPAADHFNLAVFNHQQCWLSAEAMPASPGNLAAARRWLGEHLVASGGRADMLTPLQQALQQLQEGCRTDLPLVFLVTGGSVDDERGVCSHLAAALEQLKARRQQQQGQQLAPRVSTFGIGGRCNHAFLQQMAEVGRGSFDAVLAQDSIRHRLQQQVLATRAPALVDLRLAAASLPGLQMFPRRLPDVFSHQPVVAFGR